MKKLLLASVCLLSTPALALPNPIGCYAWVATPEYAAKHSNEQIAALRLSVEKVTKEDREGWNWSFWLDVMLRGSTDVLGNHGGCDETRAPGALRCYLDYKFPGGGGGRVIFTPGRKPNIFITDPIRTDNNKLHLSFEGEDRTLKLQRVNPAICERDVGKALEGLRKLWGGEPK